MHAGRTQGNDSKINAGVVHKRDACFPGPAKRRKSSDWSVVVLRRLPEEVGDYVVMRVDRHAILCV
jgi:hypothetical protein